MKRLILILALLSQIGHAQLPALPNWVNNNELIDGTVTPAAYEYLLGASSWVTGPPPTCTFGSLPSAYPDTTAGAQAFVGAMEACRTLTGVGIILDIPVTSHVVTTSILFPQTNTSIIHATTPLIIRSVNDSTLASMPEPVCAGGIQDNIFESLQIGLRNPDCNGVNAAGLLVECPTQSAGSGGLAYQLGITTFCIPAGSFSLANGTATTNSKYNYLQYMPQFNATGTTAPFIFCSVAPGATAAQTCNNPGTVPQFGPDYWLIEDLAISESAGNHNPMNLVNVNDNGGNSNSVGSWASHIHFRRNWFHADWTNLSSGYGQISTAVVISRCFYCSMVGNHASELLRPGGEGHIVEASGSSLKISNNWFEGQSSCVFVGGSSGAFDITPVGSYIAGTDVEQRRTRCTFPYSWLGSPYGPGNIFDADPYWGGAGDNPSLPTKVNVASNGTTVTYVSGPTFHDSTSAWLNNNVFINGVTNGCWNAGTSKAVKCTIAAIGSGTFPGSPPTTVTLTLPVCNTACTGPNTTGLTNVGFILNGSSIVRKNGDEKKSWQRMLLSGNITENSDISGGQGGLIADFSNRNCSGGCQGTNYQNTGLDLNVQDDIYRNACNDYTTSKSSASSAGNGGGVTDPSQRLSFWNVLHYNISTAYSGAVTNYCPTGGTKGFQINAPSQSWTVAVTPSTSPGGIMSATANGTGNGCTVGDNLRPFQVGSSGGLLKVSGVSSGVPTSYTITNPGSNYTTGTLPAGGSDQNCKNVTVNIGAGTSSGFATAVGTFSVDAASNLESETITFNTSSGTTVTLNTSPSNTYQVGNWVSFPCSGCTGDSGNIILQNNGYQVKASTGATVQIDLGGGNSWSGSLAGGSLIQGPAGFQYFGIPTGFPVLLTGCSGLGEYNTSTTTIGPLTTTGASAWNGVWTSGYPGPTGLQFYFPISTAEIETCTLSNVGGGPQNLYINKNTDITDASQPIGAGNSVGQGYPLAINGGIQDNIFLNSNGALNTSGWDNLSFNEGKATENFQFDATTFSTSNNVIPRPSGAASLYTYYGNNPNVLNTCLAPTGCTWPSTFFPMTMCGVGFIAPACSGFVPLSFPDYHNYSLAGTSLFIAASTTAGPVGTIIPNLDIAQTNNTYFCQVMGVPVTCTNGPYPDNVGTTPPVTSPTAPAAKAFALLERRTMSGGTN